MTTLAEKFIEIEKEIRSSPTVEAGAILLLVNVRWVIEANASNEAAMRELAHVLDVRCAELADAVVKDTPAEAVSVERAAKIQAEADKDGTQ